MDKLPYNITVLQNLYQKGNIIFQLHATRRLLERNIKRNDVKQCILSGEIIETYVDDTPCPSCLVLGYYNGDMPLHVVCSSDGEYIYIITAYVPNTTRFNDDFKTRRTEI